MEINIHEAITKLGLDIHPFLSWPEITKSLILRLAELQERIEKLENKSK